MLLHVTGITSPSRAVLWHTEKKTAEYAMHIATDIRVEIHSYGCRRRLHTANDLYTSAYHYLNDFLGLERLDWQFICLKCLFNGINNFAPWSQERPPKRILNLATGTGVWAIEVAEEFESSMAIGTDSSPM
ncbi:hypothetical protein HD806DRAFT_438785 [Xylariaceae sp. AK1471]|nr:hypothetical protein HD806DRAFT_438785 [Xylariaceae sp. AK1471]